MVTYYSFTDKQGRSHWVLSLKWNQGQGRLDQGLLPQGSFLEETGSLGVDEHEGESWVGGWPGADDFYMDIHAFSGIYGDKVVLALNLITHLELRRKFGWALFAGGG